MPDVGVCSLDRKEIDRAGLGGKEDPQMIGLCNGLFCDLSHY